MNGFEKRLRFPAAKGLYKVQVNSGDWRAFSAARLQISMNNPKHAGDKFFAEAEWVSARFEKAQLIVSDTLHRHNIMVSHGVDEQVARSLALQAGDRWIADNAKAIAALPNREITRWDDWLLHPKFATNHAQVMDCYAKNPAFAQRIDQTAASFVDKKNGISDKKRDEYIDRSRVYLLEEIAAFAVMHDAAPMVDIRPGSPLKPVLDLLKSGAVEGAPDGYTKMSPVIIDFTRNKAFSA